MKYISEEDNNKVLNEIRTKGFDNYLSNRTICESSSNEPIVIRVKGSISEYARRNGYIDAREALNIIAKMRNRK